ncbi:hypothetical protein EYC84_000136 [Monilinia fructicola]|uniref:Uncharacterized protein n=1 Tax=Monilinia fructicola TaxID=38448 RepID=A0A5M9JNA0_MONFR|nr:hypothetical protein EYC84_000136 [Monilinia fructicola]
MNQHVVSPSPSFCSSFTVVSEVILNEKITLALNYVKDYEQRMLSRYNDLISLQAENRSIPESSNPLEGTRDTFMGKIMEMIMMKTPTNGNIRNSQTVNQNAQKAMVNRVEIRKAKLELSEIKIDIEYLEKMIDRIMEDKLVMVPFRENAPPLNEDDIEGFEKIAGGLLRKWEEKEKRTART